MCYWALNVIKHLIYSLNFIQIDIMRKNAHETVVSLEFLFEIFLKLSNKNIVFKFDDRVN